MKLLYIANSRLPTEKAHGYQIINTCHALATQGVYLTLLAPQRFNRIKQCVFDYYGQEKLFIIKKIFCLDLLPLPFFKKIYFLTASLSFALNAKRYAKSNFKNYDAIYTRDFLIAKLLLTLGKPLYYELHTMPAKITAAHKKVWLDCAGLVVISDGLRRELLKYGIEQNKILVARDAVDLNKFNLNISKHEAREKLNLPFEKKIIVYAGHLYFWKGANTLAQASGILPEDIQVYLIGGTKGDVKSFRNKYKNKNLHIIGNRPQAEIPIWLKAADLLILPNSQKQKISSLYTSPLKLFEYMASGTPIIASRISSIQEIINKEDADFFIPDDAANLAERIKQYQPDKNSIIKAEKARQKIVQYSWENRAKRIINFILK